MHRQEGVLPPEIAESDLKENNPHHSVWQDLVAGPIGPAVGVVLDQAHGVHETLVVDGSADARLDAMRTLGGVRVVRDGLPVAARG